jgi:hypothetical protein
MNIDIKPHHAGGGSWPEPHHLALLQACLLSPDEAVPAWRRWREMVSLNELDVASWKLLPLAGWNLLKHLPDDAALQEAAGFQRYYWAKNQKLLHSLRQLAESHLPGCDKPMVMKGAALAFDFYPQPGLRPMEDIDLLLTPFDCGRIVDRLLAEGCVREADSPFLPAGSSAGTVHGLKRQDGLQLDIHTYVFHRNTRLFLADRFRARSASARQLPALIRVPAAEHLLLHVLAHGYHWAPSVPARWMADAWWIHQKAGSHLDWDEFLRMTRETGETIAARKTLFLLHETLHFHLPKEVRRSLETTTAGWRERLAVRVTTVSVPRYPVERLVRQWLRFSMIQPRIPIRKRIAWLAGYYHRQWTHYEANRPLWKVGFAKTWKNLRLALHLSQPERFS